MHKTFLIADTHWKHAWYSHEARQEERYIDEWNTVVGTEDTVFHLGDVAHNKRAFPRLKHLNGYKILITGNHDGYPTNIYTEYFAEVHTHYLLRAYYKKGNILLTHMPVCPKWKPRGWCDGPDNVELYTTYANTVWANIHGHFHQYGLSTFKYGNTNYHKSVPYTLFTVYDRLIELPQLLIDIETAA